MARSWEPIYALERNTDDDEQAEHLGVAYWREERARREADDARCDIVAYQVDFDSAEVIARASDTAQNAPERKGATHEMPDTLWRHTWAKGIRGVFHSPTNPRREGAVEYLRADRAQRHYVVNLRYHDDGTIVVHGGDIRGLVIESQELAEVHREITHLAPRLLRANHGLSETESATAEIVFRIRNEPTTEVRGQGALNKAELKEGTALMNKLAEAAQHEDPDIEEVFGEFYGAAPFTDMARKLHALATRIAGRTTRDGR